MFWMRSRKAYVLAGGSQSADMVLEDQVHQGSVWGCSLFGDAERPLRKTGFTPVVNTDDLNATKEVDSAMDNEDALAEGQCC